MVDKIKKQFAELGSTLQKQEDLLSTHTKTIKSMKDENVRLRDRNEKLNEQLRKDKVKSMSPGRKYLRTPPENEITIKKLKKKDKIDRSRDREVDKDEKETVERDMREREWIRREREEKDREKKIKVV